MSENIAIGLATGDECLRERIESFQSKPMFELVELLDHHNREIKKQREKVEKKIETLVSDRDLLTEMITQRMIADEAEAIPHPTLDVRLETSTRLEKDVHELVKLQGIIPEIEFRSAMPLVQHDPEYVPNAVKLKQIGKKYGKTGGVSDIIARGLRHVPVGKPKLIVRHREIDTEIEQQAA